MTNLRAEPAICPACGELVVLQADQLLTLIVPPHPDAVTPWLICAASDQAMQDVLHL